MERNLFSTNANVVCSFAAIPPPVFWDDGGGRRHVLVLPPSYFCSASRCCWFSLDWWPSGTQSGGFVSDAKLRFPPLVLGFLFFCCPFLLYIMFFSLISFFRSSLHGCWVGRWPWGLLWLSRKPPSSHPYQISASSGPTQSSNSMGSEGILYRSLASQALRGPPWPHCLKERGIVLLLHWFFSA